MLATLSTLMIMISFLTYQIGETGEASLNKVDLSADQMRFVNQSQSSIANAQLFYANSFMAGYEGDTRSASDYLNQAKTNRESAQSYFTEFESHNPREEQPELFDALATAFDQLIQQGLMPLETALQTGNETQFRIAREVTSNLNQQFIAASTAYNDRIANHNHQLVADFESDMQLMGYIEVIVLLITAVIVLFFRTSMTGAIVKPLDQAVEHFERIAENDLSGQITEYGRNEIGRLFSAMQHMQNNLCKTVSEVRDSSGSIYIGAREIASGNEDLSSRTEEQASSLQETAASMEQLTATVRQNADNARQASTLANDASQTAIQGGEVVDQVITTMHGIAGSSQKVTDIISVIDSIAFQTNILALNASVEAARAGEQGRGFAVVASEVRNLASRSAGAAKEIKALIDASSAQIKEGSALVESAGTTMRNVVSSVRRVNDIMDEISAASQEQSSGIEQVNQAVTQMDEVTQHNASLVQQASSAASSLEEQAARFESVVASFRLIEREATTPQASLAPPKPSPALRRPAPQGQTGSHADLDWEAF